jgi:hypothetical protein
MPNVSNPQVTVRTTAGTLDDAVMETYYSWSSDCASMNYIVCEDDNTNGNGSLMPVINLQGGAGATIWVRVWGYGGATGTFSICVLNYYTPNVGGEGGDIITIPSSDDRGYSQPTILTSCQATVSGMDITASNVAEGSAYILSNSLGQIVCQGKATDNTIQCQADTRGIYFLYIVDGMGNKCVQKIFVN